MRILFFKIQSVTTVENFLGTKAMSKTLLTLRVSKVKNDSLRDILFAKARKGGDLNNGRFAAFIRYCIDVHENSERVRGQKGDN